MLQKPDPQWVARPYNHVWERPVNAKYFSILGLRPGNYSRATVDRQYRAVRRQILRAGGPDRQRRLDDALIAHILLRDPWRQDQFARRAVAHVAAARRRPAMASPTVALPPPASPVLRFVAPPVTAPVAGQADASDTAVFARMVLDHVESGLLRFTARERLVQLAHGMGIGEFKANLIIAEVLHEVRADLRRAPEPRVHPPPLVLAATRVQQSADPARAGHGARLLLALLAAAAIDGLILAWLWLTW